MGSRTELFRVGLTRVKACKSFLFTDGPLKVENKEHLNDLVVTFYSISLRFIALHSGKVTINFSKVEKEKIIGQFVGTSKICNRNGDRGSKTDKSCLICSMRLKNVLVKYEKYGTLSLHLFIVLLRYLLTYSWDLPDGQRQLVRDIRVGFCRGNSSLPLLGKGSKSDLPCSQCQLGSHPHR